MPPTIVSNAKPTPAYAAVERVSANPVPYSWVAIALLASLAALAGLMEHNDLNIDPVAPSSIAFGLAFTVIIAVRYVFRAPTTTRERVWRDMAEYYGLLTGLALIGAVASYPVAAETRGYVDAGLQRADMLLHFHWLVWYDLVAAHRWLQVIGTVAYQSIFVSPVLLAGHFALRGDRVSAYRLIVAFWISAVLALALFSIMPAIGPLAYLSKDHVPYLPDSELYMADLIPALRLHAVHIIDLGAIRGLVSAPSFHTVCGVLFITAAWPHRALRRPIVALNAAMLLATPIEGTHYLIDMILGAIVALVAVGAATLLLAYLARHRQAGSTAISVTP